MFLRNSMFGTASMLGLAGILSFAGCSSNGKSSDLDEVTEGVTGSIGLGLTLPDGSNVDQVNYVITQGTVQIRTGVIAIGADGRATTTITGLEPGTGYRVVLTAPRGDAGAPCVGEGTFTVVANATATVDVLLLCDDLGESGNVTINGSFNICPRVTSTSISPVTVAVGSTASITTTWRDRDSDTLSYLWTAPSGSFAPAAAASTTYTCAAVGTQVLTVTANDGATRGCSRTATVSVNCVAGNVDAGSTADAGVVVVDSGTTTIDSGTTVVDSGTTVVDSGTTEIDSGTTVVDSGTTVVDSGTTVVDSGTTVVDSGTTVVDSGTTEIDSGMTVVDSGATVVDSGTTVVDSGSPVVDSGTGTGTGRSAACQQCLTTSCTLYQEELPVLSQCNTPECNAIVACVEQTKCARDSLTVTNCYCGDVSFDTCQPADYAPVGVCKAAIEGGLQTTVKSTVLERFVDPTFPGGAAMGLVTCMADLCAAPCLTP